MKEIIGFIKDYYGHINKRVLVLCTLFMAILVWLNYGHNLEYHAIEQFGLVTAHYSIYLVAFLFAYILWIIIKKRDQPLPFLFIIMILVAPLLFAIKVSMDTTFHYSDDPDWKHYWNETNYWPPRVLFVIIVLAAVHRFVAPTDTWYGLRPKKMNWKPYFIMVLIMVPLITAASTQPDFLSSYPRLNDVLPLPDDARPAWWYKVLFELCYGSDFFTIELFFRGFLIIGFARWAGKDAILPMACFYCTIHFGKPLGECISSYFGGMLLGIVSYHTRSIYGGLIVHLGIAWLMDLGGYIGNNLMK
jgi:hypothetical protein